jgi:hypothetical protein
MNKRVIARELIKIAKELLADSWVEIPKELVERSDLSGAKTKVMDGAIRTVVEMNGKPHMGTAFRLDTNSWLASLGKLLGVPSAKHAKLEKWVNDNFPQTKK